MSASAEVIPLHRLCRADAAVAPVKAQLAALMLAGCVSTSTAKSPGHPAFLWWRTAALDVQQLDNLRRQGLTAFRPFLERLDSYPCRPAKDRAPAWYIADRGHARELALGCVGYRVAPALAAWALTVPALTPGGAKRPPVEPCELVEGYATETAAWDAAEQHLANFRRYWSASGQLARALGEDR